MPRVADGGLRYANPPYGLQVHRRQCHRKTAALPGHVGDIAAVPPRGPAGDAFVSKRHASFSQLPPGASLATSSQRRRAQVLHRRPDLRLVDQKTRRVFYLDPKLYAVGSRDISFRAFYFEPKIATNKVRDDAVHLVVGFEHEPRKDGRWNFTRWDLVDLSQFKVRLKAEFQGSNHDMYRPEAIVATSAK